MPKKYVGRRNWGSHLMPFLWSLNVMRAQKMRCFLLDFDIEARTATT